MATPADSVILEEEIDENYEPTQDGASSRCHKHPRADRIVASPRASSPRRAVSSPQKKEPRHRRIATSTDPSHTSVAQTVAQTEMIDYAKWLGMDLEKEKDLMWIAREGLKAPLPDNWKPCKAPDTGDIYYFNFQTGESVWDHPCDEYYKNLYATEKANLEKRIAERERPATAAVARPGTAAGIRPGTASGGLRPATSAGANPLDRPRLGSLAPLGGGLNPLDRPVTAARPLGGVPASVGMRMDNGGYDSDGGSEGSMGGFGGIDSPSAARAPGSSAEVWRAEEDAADGAAREAYTAKLSTAREAWEKELEKEDANARRRRELERDKEQLRLDQEEAKVRREMEERFERVALELKKASVRREEEAEATATAKEKEAESRTKEAEELLRLAAEKIADAKARSAAAAAIVAESEGSVHAQTERSVKFLDAEKARLSKEEEDKIRGEIEPEISALRAKLEAERDALKRQVEDAAKETARAKTNDEAGGRIAALMAATESHVIPEIEEMHVKAAQSSAQRRIEMAEARAQAAEEEARHRISDAEEAVIAADKQAMDAINAAKAQERSVPYVSESEDEGFTIKRKSPSRGSGRSSRTSARGLDSDSDGDDSDGGFESLRGDEERTIERFDPDENPAIASPGGKINVASLRSAVAAGDDEMMLARARSFLRDQRRHSEERRTATQRASSEWRAAEIALMEPGMDEDLREKRRSMIKAIRAALDVSMSAFTAEMRVMRALKVAVRSAAYTGASWPAVFSSTIMAKQWDLNEFDPKEVFGRLEPAPGASRAARGTRAALDTSMSRDASMSDLRGGSPQGSPGGSPRASSRASLNPGAAFDTTTSAALAPPRVTTRTEDPLDRIFGKLKQSATTQSSKPHPVFSDTSGMSESFLKRSEEWAKAAERERALIGEHAEWMAKFKANMDTVSKEWRRPRRTFRPAPALASFAPTIPPQHARKSSSGSEADAELERAAQRAVDAVVALEAESREEAVPATMPVEGGN